LVPKHRKNTYRIREKKEEWEIDNLVEQEKDEIRDIYKEKGFKGELLYEIVWVITSRRKVWIDTMMKEELGLIEDKRRPRDTAITTFIAFNIIGLIPIVPFMFIQIFGTDMISTTSNAFSYSVIFTAISIFLIAIIRGKIVGKGIIRTGLNTMAVGGIAASVAYIVGYVSGEVINQ